MKEENEMEIMRNLNLGSTPDEKFDEQTNEAIHPLRVTLSEGVTFDIINVKVEEQPLKLPSDTFRSIVDEIMEKIERDPEDFIDYDSADFELSYDNRINLTHIDIDLQDIESMVEDVLREFFDVTD